MLWFFAFYFIFSFILLAHTWMYCISIWILNQNIINQMRSVKINAIDCQMEWVFENASENRQTPEKGELYDRRTDEWSDYYIHWLKYTYNTNTQVNKYTRHTQQRTDDVSLFSRIKFCFRSFFIQHRGSDSSILFKFYICHRGRYL